MGNLCSISVSIDDIVASFWGCTCRPANYICKLEENQLALRIALRKLIELRNDVKRKVDLAERQQMKPLDQVQGWLSRVEALETAFSEMRGSAAMEANRLGSYRIKGFMSRSVDHWLIWVGRCWEDTLMTQINNALYKTTHDFDVVIWAVVSSDPDPRKVQDEIWKKIGFCDDIWKNKSQDDKAIEIFQILNKKKFVLFLDDIWKWFDLLRVGVPFPDQENKSKIVFTTRSEEVCCSMGAQKIIKVECLAWGRAWDLFRSKVGEDTINFHPDIPQLAKTVANECGGLPLALITIGRAMACKRTPREWNHAIKVLHNSASNFPEMDLDGGIHDYCFRIRESQGKVCGASGASLTHVPEVAGWTGAKRISLINNQIEKLSGVPRCPNLSTFFLGVKQFEEALDVIPKGLISSLSTLKVLKMAYCGSSHDEITEENVLSGVSVRQILELHSRFMLQIFNDSSSINISFLEDMKNLDIIFISHCSILEDLKVDWMRYRKETVAPHGLHKCFHSLHTVEVDRCPMLKDLTWLIFAPNLRHLFIINCNSLTEVIHKGVAEAGNVRGILTNSCNGCPKLKKLPLNSECDKEGGSSFLERKTGGTS
ncbi:putative disease resistance protein [Vitis vinifera]|uniref:Putative disease resistance protein n=1 Tax=Vitis vinifera TaxID=29760 RepID=A0A438GF29_VITVI|nr:putative disease resistance protein [Vitis vinifera]